MEKEIDKIEEKVEEGKRELTRSRRRDPLVGHT